MLFDCIVYIDADTADNCIILSLLIIKRTIINSIIIHETQPLHVTPSPYSFTSKIEIDCPTNLNPEHLSPYCTVDSYYREEDALHVRIKHLKINLTTVKNELLAARSDKL